MLVLLLAHAVNQFHLPTNAKGLDHHPLPLPCKTSPPLRDFPPIIAPSPIPPPYPATLLPQKMREGKGAGTPTDVPVSGTIAPPKT